MRTPAERLKWARERAAFETATDAARSRGWVVSTYLGHENGDRVPSRTNAKRYAKAFKVRWEWLLEGDGSPDDRTTAAPLRGYVGAGALVIPVEESGHADERIDLPPGAPPNTEVLIVRGDSMYPRYWDGEKVFYAAEHHAPDELIDQECVVKLKSGEVLIKRIRRGRRKFRYNLESFNAPILEDQAIEWAAPVRWRG